MQSETFHLRPEEAESLPPDRSWQVDRYLKLGDRERQILEYVAYGRSNDQIAEILKLKRKTVEMARLNIYKKLGIHNISDATRFYIEAVEGKGKRTLPQKEFENGAGI